MPCFLTLGVNIEFKRVIWRLLVRLKLPVHPGSKAKAPDLADVRAFSNFAKRLGLRGPLCFSQAPNMTGTSVVAAVATPE